MQTNKDDALILEQQYNKSHFSNFELYQLSKLSILGITMMFIVDDTLQIIGDAGLIERPFGYLPSIDNLQCHHNNVFEVLALKSSDSLIYRYKLLYRKSVIEIKEIDKLLLPDNAEDMAEYHHKKPDLIKIIYANIQDKGIILEDSILVGINQELFFGKIFKNAKCQTLNNINVIQMIDILEENGTIVFIFSKGRLKQIKIGNEKY